MSQENQRKLADHLFAVLLSVFIGIGVGIVAGLYDRPLSFPSGVVGALVAFLILRRLICKKTP